jgi:hypothetical protein
MEIRSLQGIFVWGFMCVKKLHVQILLSFCVKIFAATAVKFLEFNVCMGFFFVCVCVGGCVKKPTCTDPAFLLRILLLI